MNLNSRSFIFILPVAFSWLATSGNPQLILVSLLVMALAEALRQYLSAKFVRKPETPRQLFFFGVIYKDSHGLFLNRSVQPLADFPRGRKFLMLAVIYILTLSVRFSPAFAALDFIFTAFFSLIITLWIYSGTYQALGRILTLQILGTCVAFSAAAETNTAGFLFWLGLSLWTQMQLHSWQLNENSRRHPDENSLVVSSSEIFKAGALVLILIVCFRVADLFIPDYDEEARTAPPGEANYSFTNDRKKSGLPKKLLQKAAKFKLQAGAIDLNKLNTKNLKLPGAEKDSAPFQLPSSSTFSYGENQQSLEEIKENLVSDKPLAPGDLEKLRDLSKKIDSVPEIAGVKVEGSGSHSLADSQDKTIDERIDKLKAFPVVSSKDIKQNEDDAAAYVRSRKELSNELDKLILQDQKNTLLKEEMNLQKLFEKLLAGVKKFFVLIALTILLAWWLGRKAGASKTEALDAKTFSLPKEVRMHLKTLYKMLLNGKFSAKEEVLKSFYIVELAFKEAEFARAEDLPPLNFLEKLERDMPFLFSCARIPIELFSRVFYGDKTPDDSQMRELRSSMHDLMKKLRVI